MVGLPTVLRSLLKDKQRFGLTVQILKPSYLEERLFSLFTKGDFIFRHGIGRYQAEVDLTRRSIYSAVQSGAT